MDKFKNTVICCDIDGTLIDDNFEIPAANLEAIEYFKSKGGIFTVATGRALDGIALYMDKLILDYPIICQNGSAVYDYKKCEYLWCQRLDKKAAAVIEYVHKKFPGAGVELMTTKGPHCIFENHATRKHEADEHYKLIPADIDTAEGDWLKIVFAESPDETDKIQAFLEKSKYFDEYKMVRSYHTYYEFVNKKTNKARAVEEISKILDIDIKNFVVIGDNGNDCEMLSLPCKSFAPSSAAQVAKDCADIVLKSSNNDGVLKEVLEFLEK